MRNLFMIIGLGTTMLMVSCGAKNGATDNNTKPKVAVQIVHKTTGAVSDNLELSATTIYLSRNTVLAPIPAYITAVYVKIGDKVQAGQVLYELESKERRALGNTPVNYDSSLKGYGRIKVRATGSGVISAVDRQQIGDYVLEGTSLCTISQNDATTFQVNVPYEFIQYTQVGAPCTIVLPDGSNHAAVFTKPLANMNVATQTQSVLAQTSGGLSLPEGLIAKVLVTKGMTGDKQLLPRICVLSDETMKEFWIMHLVNDSTAVKLPVTIGNRNKEEIEIISPVLANDDRVLSVGNYGLPDTALVKVVANK